MSDINIFFQAVDSTDGYQAQALSALHHRIGFKSCLMTVKSDGADEYPQEYYHPVNYDICEQNRYGEIVDMEELLPLSGEIVSAMAPYELTAMRMLIRNYERDIYTMDESRRFYLRHLRFWNHMLVTYGVNYAFFNNTPHHTHDYVIYALCQVYGIKTCVCISTNFEFRYFLAPTLDTPQERTTRLYLEKYRDIPEGELSLPEDIETYYATIAEGSREKMENQALQGVSRQQEINDKMAMFTRDLSYAVINRKNASLWKNKVLKGRSQRDRDEARTLMAFRKALCQRDKIKLRSMVGTQYYNSLADMPVNGEEYVIYFLHYQPEATSLPQGGVFNDQELSVSIMARACAAYGVKLYVKEHFVQPRRMKFFYDDLAAIPNVRLIKTQVNSADLSAGSLCAATGNGTVVLESVIRGTPIIIFGESGFAGCPGVHKVSSVEEVTDILPICRREKSEGISRRDIRAYLAAFGENSLYSRVYSNEGLRRDDPYFRDSLEKLVDCIEGQIKGIVDI